MLVFSTAVVHGFSLLPVKIKIISINNCKYTYFYHLSALNYFNLNVLQRIKFVSITHA